MPQPRKLSDYSEFQPKKERRSPLPITAVPTNSTMTEEADPTHEIRTLIEQLQQTARDARGQLRVVEEERDEITLKLARAQQQIETLHETESELRSHFVEVTSIIQERDHALAEAEQRTQALAEAQRKGDATARVRDEAQRQRDEAIRQRDEAVQRAEAIQRTSEETARLISETQRQILAIRQARDTAHVQIFDLNKKLGHAEDQIAELEFQRDASQKAQKQAEGEASNLRRQLDLMNSDRDATARQVEQLTSELDVQRQKLLNLAEQKSAELQTDAEHAAALAAAREQVASLTQERDVARTRAQDQTAELEQLRVQDQASRDEEARNSDLALTEAREKIVAVETQARELRHEGNNLRQQLEGLKERLASSQQAAESADAHVSGTREELAAVTRARDAALTSLTAAQKQIDHIIRDRDEARELATRNALELEGQIAALKGQMAALETNGEDARAQKDQLTRVNARFEKQRLEMIDLAAQLQAAQRQVRELSANLAEARLQVKFAQAAGRATMDGRTKSDFAALIPAEESAPVPEPAPAPPAILNLDEPLTEKEARGALGAMRHCFQSFTRTPNDLSLLNELHCQVQSFAERARVSGLIAPRRLCTAFAWLARGLYELPEQVNPSTLRTVHQTIEFLALLMKEKSLAQVIDPARAMIYAVDDDAGNCESIALAMEESAMRTTCTQDPVMALADLSGTPCDLIFLDVNMPGMDGFELCRKLRALPAHATTPIVFLTGLATVENRVQSSLSGGNDFIAKPFNLRELSVKAITLLLKAQLRIE